MNRFEGTIPEVLDVGDGDAILFSNSSITDYSMFQPQIDVLVDAGYRVLAANNPAFTPDGREPYSLLDLVERTRTLLVERGIERVVLVGSSMGGYMALRFARLHPEMVAGLVLVGTTALGNTADEITSFLSKFGELEGHERMTRDWAEWCSTILFSATARRDQPHLVEQWVERAVGQFPGEAFVEEARSWLLREDYSAELEHIRAPALVVHGADDIAIPLERARPLAEDIPGARLLVVPQAGHLVNLERPDQVNHELMQFLEEVYQ